MIENTFTVEDDRFGEVVTTDLCPGGTDMAVTEENKKEYVQLITEWRIQRRVEDQFKAFLSGFHELIPQELINVFDENELEVGPFSLWCAPCIEAFLATQLLIGGMSDVDVDDWFKHTDYRVRSRYCCTKRVY